MNKEALATTNAAVNETVTQASDAVETIGDIAVCDTAEADTSGVLEAAETDAVEETAEKSVEDSEVSAAKSDEISSEESEKESSEGTEENHDYNQAEKAPDESDKKPDESDKKPDESEEQSEESPPRAKGRLPVFLTIVLIVLAVILLLPASLLVYGAIPHRTEIGKNISLPLNDVPILAAVCDVKTDLDEIDTSALGKHSLEFEFFGFLPIKSSLIVRDSTPPSVTTHTLFIPRGTEVHPEEFISEATDLTELTYDFIHQVDSENGGTVIFIATDECGNQTTCTAELIINDRLTHCTIELGTLKEILANELLTLEWLSDLDFDKVDFSQCGTYRITGKLNGANCLFDVTIVDTTAPLADAISYDIILGQTLTPEDFLVNVSDGSEVTTCFETEPDFEKLGNQQISILLEDAYGNTTRLEANLNIHYIEASFIIEAGTPTDVFANEVFSHIDTQAPLPRLADDLITEQFSIGTHEVMLIGEYSKIPIELIVEDTIPPALTLKPTNVYVGTTPDATDFIKSCNDASTVTFAFSEAVDASRLGEQVVTIIATDEAGNFTSVSTSMYVIKDTTKPVIYGVKPITAHEGESISYRSGVWATDDNDGTVTVKVNSSGVNTSVVGTYYVTYTATDSSGNTQTVTTTVTIKAISRQSVNQLADQVLAKIVTDSMTARQKAYAIYSWCKKNIKYSSLTSNLMGHFNKAAYTGLTKHYGNCYTYYAVASTLLSRVGIENIEIHRNDPSRPHYWNLVKMDGSWYHFDTCPQPAPYKLTVFLLKDSEVRAFPLSYYYDFDEKNYPATP